MDKRQSIASAGVDALERLGRSDDSLRARWRPVEEQCFAAGSSYLGATERPESDATEEAYDAFAGAIAHLSAASAAVDQFYEAHRARLEHALSEYAAVPRLANDARTAATSVLATVTGSEPHHSYRSVRDAVDAVHRALDGLAAAESGGSGTAVTGRAAQVRSAVDDLRRALAEAPGRAGSASTALASVRTRLQAVGTKAEYIAPAYSALLREFVAASSDDLSRARENCETHMVEAARDIDDAATARDGGDPEEALDRITAARQHLSDAEADIEAVTGRLARLREVRDDPGAVDRRVRFRLRDAQLLAVDRGLVAEWGSVLDAQLARIERAAEALGTGRPDYWAYLRELDSVEDFISGVVDRIRGRQRRT
ncbi:hypothetical protein HQ325_11210 [Rhodococcus sp. BP-349]|nr:hypothetical protein [Rhodococcus sp. BP-363]MBY6544432.1 hypothetical protein [Rhodococcus sp. BP-369]MBY6563662.1 hypothetical protein [Rhodococcus sp. BP-370]MBY6577954.1 hypothetical protein [Rhodococcus sp. BP-364]MBY6587255.1 hypothetical protein [Rhodococcus sp. BP-358]MBY6591592.1 hypothetical protein [Rhodococcus sp. BP-362]MBY6595074.1 hypothetical protein [Rhodococcus sp. BP-359]MBY6599413.1 hypothetical protein [Rhodococcus sp. BP-353]MBY6603750.1 hypothetical protein [Rhodoc